MKTLNTLSAVASLIALGIILICCWHMTLVLLASIALFAITERHLALPLSKWHHKRTDETECL